VERAWSDYNTLANHNLKKACDHSYYKAGLQMWDCLIYSLEYLKTLPGFPYSNKGDGEKMDNRMKQSIIEELK